MWGKGGVPGRLLGSTAAEHTHSKPIHNFNSGYTCVCVCVCVSSCFFRGVSLLHRYRSHLLPSTLASFEDLCANMGSVTSDITSTAPTPPTHTHIHIHPHMQNGATSSDKEVAFMRIMAEDLLGRSGGVRERVQEFSFKISAATPSIVTNRIRIHYGGSRQLPSNPLGHIYTRARAHTSTHTHKHPHAR